MKYRISFEAYSSKFVTFLSFLKTFPGLLIWLCAFEAPLLLITNALDCEDDIFIPLFGGCVIVALVSWVLFLLFFDLDKLDDKLSKSTSRQVTSENNNSQIYKDFICSAEKEIDKIIVNFSLSVHYKCVVDIKNYWINFLSDTSTRNAEKRREIIENNTDIKKWALASVSERAFDVIASGKYHVQNVLTPEGELLVNVYRYCSEEEFRAGYINKEMLDKKLKTLRKQIWDTGHGYKGEDI